MATRTERITEYLRYDYTPEELQDLSKTMAREYQEKDALEDKKKEVMSAIKAEIDKKTTVLSDLSSKLNSGYVWRNTDCEVQFNEPQVGYKTTVRLDTGEVVRTAAMSPAEMQEPLFETTDTVN